MSQQNHCESEDAVTINTVTFEIPSQMLGGVLETADCFSCVEKCGFANAIYMACEN